MQKTRQPLQLFSQLSDPVDALYGLDSESEEYLATEFEVLRSRPLAEKVVRKLDLASEPAFMGEEGSLSTQSMGSMKDKLVGLVGLGKSQDERTRVAEVEQEIARRESVSYTHLTLPTICSV